MTRSIHTNTHRPFSRMIEHDEAARIFGDTDHADALNDNSGPLGVFDDDNSDTDAFERSFTIIFASLLGFLAGMAATVGLAWVWSLFL